jgi:hypothetical protein
MWNAKRNSAMLVVAGLSVAGCGERHGRNQPAIEFLRIPQADEGGRDKHDIVEGRVTGALPGEQIVLYAKSGNWWVQPIPGRPFTRIQKSAKWTNATHLGTDYAALLVKPGFQPPAELPALPAQGELVSAVATVKGANSPPSPFIRFSGYEWRVRNAVSRRGNKDQPYDPRNAWTDAGGALHLRIAKSSNEWSCAEVSNTRSLGYGTYSFTVRDTSNLDPAAVFGMFTYDYARADQSFGEAAIEIGRWGDPTGKNAQFILQPHYISNNVSRFMAPPGILTHSFRWEPGRISFRTTRGSKRDETAPAVAEHVFTSGVPEPGIESARMNVYVYYEPSRISLAKPSEVVIDRFEYLP